MSTKHFTGLQTRIQPFVQNSQLVYEVKRTPGYALMGIDVFLRGNFVLSGGTVNGTAQGENPTGIIQKIDIDALARPDGNARGGKLKSCTPRTYNKRRIFDRGLPLADLKGNTVSGAAATTAVASMIPLEFAIPNATRPIETALDLAQYDQILATVYTGALTDMLAGNDRTVDLSGLFVEFVERREYIGDGKNSDGSPLILGEIYEDDKTIQITAANTDFALDTQLSQAQAYVDLFLIAETTSKVLSDAIINSVQVFSGTDGQGKLYADHVKGLQQKFVKDAATTMTGLYYLPQAQGMSENAGLLSGVVPNVSCKLDVSNPGTDRFFAASRRFAPSKAVAR